MNRMQTILENKKGYRNDGYFGEGYRNLKEVLKHEIGEMCNVDVLDTLKDLYPEDFNDTKQVYMQDDVITKINHGEHTEEEIKEYVEDIHRILQQKLGVEEDLKVIWVCATKEDVQNNYTFDDYEEENLDDFDFTDDEEESDEPLFDTVIFEKSFLIISDLGEEGFLVATTEFYFE